MSEVLDANEYGSFSTKWMIRRLAEHVPRENLEMAFGVALSYIDGLSLGLDVIPPQDALDALGQMIATQKYFPTAFPRTTSLPMTLADPEDEDGEESPGQTWLRENEITEDEIENFAAQMDEWPDAKDPYDD